jgi:hypothetical protein
MTHATSTIRKPPIPSTPARHPYPPRHARIYRIGASGRQACGTDKKGRLARSGLCRMATDGRSGRFPALPYPPVGAASILMPSRRVKI